MKERLKRIAKWVAYPLFYLFCLALFGYLTFPYNRLKDRLIAEFERAQSKRGQPSGQRLEIDNLTSYWFTGVDATGVRLILPPDESSKGSFDASAMAMAAMGAPQEEPKDSVIAVDRVQARLRMLPLLLGRTKVAFWASVFGGHVEGLVPIGASSGPVEVELGDIDIGLIEPLVALVGVPLKGAATGKLDLAASEGKFSKANGSFELSITGASIGDGKTKLKGLVALPEAKLGEITVTAEATAGTMKITKLASTGPDVELIGEGKVQVREPWNDSVADLYVRFKFSDAYRDKSDETRSLLGPPGSSTGLIEMQPKVKRAKRPDGFYGFHVFGPLKKLKFDPSTSDAPGSSSGGSSKSTRKGSDSPFGGSKKAGGVETPLGLSTAGKDDSPPEPSRAADPAPLRMGATPEPARPSRDEAPAAQPTADETPQAPPVVVRPGAEPPADR